MEQEKNSETNHSSAGYGFSSSDALAVVIFVPGRYNYYQQRVLETSAAAILDSSSAGQTALLISVSCSTISVARPCYC